MHMRTFVCISMCILALLQVFCMYRNPYVWHSSAKMVNSLVVGMSIWKEDGHIVHQKNLTQPIVVFLPRKHG